MHRVQVSAPWLHPLVEIETDEFHHGEGAFGVVVVRPGEGLDDRLGVLPVPPPRPPGVAGPNPAGAPARREPAIEQAPFVRALDAAKPPPRPAVGPAYRRGVRAEG